MSLPNAQAQAIALNRFGLGARPDEVPPSDPQRWLIGQIDAFDPKPAAFAALPAPGSLAHDYFEEVGELIRKAGAAPSPPGAPAPGPNPNGTPASPPAPMSDDTQAKLMRQQRRQALNVDSVRLSDNESVALALAGCGGSGFLDSGIS